MRQTTMPNRKRVRIRKALEILARYVSPCRLCPRECGADRKGKERGFCRTGDRAVLSHALLHYGEEPVLSGHQDCSKAETDGSGGGGSGALFFSGCNLKCLHCQNYALSWENQGEEVTPDEMAERMLALQQQGAWNINLVSPSHLLVPILEALDIALARGLSLPVVYNSNAYEKAEVIALLEGIVDVYLPDCKYFSRVLSGRLSGAPDYFRHASQAIKEMHRQQPLLVSDEKGMARRGLILRHLVLPGQWPDSIRILDWAVSVLSPRVCLSLMSQYWPCHQAPRRLQRPLRADEYRKVIDHATALGFTNLFFQAESFAPGEHRLPDFSLPDPFEWR